VNDNIQSLFKPPQPPTPDIEAFETRYRWFTRIQVPTLLLVGEDALPEIQSGAEMLEQRIPGAQTRKVADARFLLNIEQPEEFNHAVLTFL
jgi:pimeloyl-ACP methyl ester carboxylesterase